MKRNFEHLSCGVLGVDHGQRWSFGSSLLFSDQNPKRLKPLPSPFDGPDYGAFSRAQTSAEESRPLPLASALSDSGTMAMAISDDEAPCETTRPQPQVPPLDRYDDNPVSGETKAGVTVTAEANSGTGSGVERGAGDGKEGSWTVVGVGRLHKLHASTSTRSQLDKGSAGTVLSSMLARQTEMRRRLMAQNHDR